MVKLGCSLPQGGAGTGKQAPYFPHHLLLHSTNQLPFAHSFVNPALHDSTAAAVQYSAADYSTTLHNYPRSLLCDTVLSTGTCVLGLACQWGMAWTRAFAGLEVSHKTHSTATEACLRIPRSRNSPPPCGPMIPSCAPGKHSFSLLSYNFMIFLT